MEENKNKQENNKKLIKILLIVAVAFSLLTVALIVAIGFLVYSTNMTKNEVQKKYIEDVYVDNTKSNNPKNTKIISKSDINKNDTKEKQMPVDKKPENRNNQSQSNNADKLIEIKDQFTEKTYVDWFDDLKEVADVNCGEYAKCYIVGKVVRGDARFVGQSIYLQVTEGMGADFTHFVIYKKDGKKYKFFFDKVRSPIAGIDDVPKTLAIDDFDVDFQSSEYITSFFKDIKDKGKHKIAKNNVLGKVYRAREDCLIAELPDHTAKAYGFDIPFVYNDARVPKINFDDGTKNKDVYSYMKHTCVNLCDEYNHNDKVSESDLKKIGTTNDGDEIYEFKDPNNKILKDLYNDKNTVAYFGDDWSDKLDHNKYSYDEFINMHPYLYWKDPFGNFVEFVNDKFTVAAEMCKPVVYFYSQGRENLHFDVKPIGGFTHTEPKYKNGWDIQTIGNGRIKDLNTGEEYDSLLWEGMALGYNVPNQGWVVAQDKLSRFFDAKLSAFGMNDKEINDFKDYWIERLNEYPYYRISFMDRNQFDKLAPLSFSKKPDNIIRIMMIAKGEQNYYNLPQQQINSTDRSGLTVVEWGGMLER